MNKLYVYIVLISAANIFSTCNSRKVNDKKNTFFEEKNKYAELFKIEKNKNITKLSVFSIGGNLKEEYFLIKKGIKTPDSLSTKNIVNVPIKKIICLSTTHIAFVEVINETDKIVGLSGTKYIYNKKLRRKAEEGKIKDIGYENSLDFELLLSLKPDLVTAYDINGNVSPVINKLKQYHIPVVIINEYSESSALAQAEWVRFFAEFFDKRKIADDFFSDISKKYDSYLKSVDTIKEKPTVLLNMPWKGTWYIPGGKSNVAQLIKDAGGKYIWENTNEQHNYALNIEEVYENASNADFWLNPGQAKKINDIIKTDVRLENFNTIKSGNIFNRNKRLNPYGGNDCMESGTVRPDLILKDIIKILHPYIFKTDTFYFYRKLN